MANHEGCRSRQHSLVSLPLRSSPSESQRRTVDIEIFFYHVCSGEFTLYDHVLDMSQTFNVCSSFPHLVTRADDEIQVIPQKYVEVQLSPLDQYFAMGRGRQRDGVDVSASEMQKFWDSNYHCTISTPSIQPHSKLIFDFFRRVDIKPEVSSHTVFKLTNNRPVEEFEEAKAAGIITRPVLVGPITYLLIGKVGRDETDAAFAPIDVIDKLVPVYIELLKKLAAAGAKEVQIDEASLCTDATASLGAVFEKTYAAIAAAVPTLKVTIATFFGRVDANITYLAKLPIHALHIDLDRAPEQLDEVVAALKPTKISLSLGLISGRNVWKNDLAASLKLTQSVIEILGADRVVVATSSSLLHTPVTLANEHKLSAEVQDWFSFAAEKVSEVATLAKAVTAPESVKAAFDANTVSIKARRDFEAGSNATVRERLAAVTPAMYARATPFPERMSAQQKVFKLPTFRSSFHSFPPFSRLMLIRRIAQLRLLSDRSPRPRRFDSPDPSSARAKSPPPNTILSSRRRFRVSSPSRRRSDSTSSSTESLSETTWCTSPVFRTFRSSLIF